jgi:hypothetical protein
MSILSPERLDQVSRLQRLAARLDYMDRAPSDDERLFVGEIAAEIQAIADELGGGPGVVVNKTSAAEFLDVSEDTVTRWLKRSVLKTELTPASPKTFIDATSVLEVKRLLDDLRAQGTDRRFFDRLASRVSASEIPATGSIRKGLRAFGVPHKPLKS